MNWIRKINSPYSLYDKIRTCQLLLLSQKGILGFLYACELRVFQAGLRWANMVDLFLTIQGVT